MTLVLDNQFPGAERIERRMCRSCGVIFTQMVGLPDPRGLQDKLTSRNDCTRCGSHLTQRVPGVLIL